MMNLGFSLTILNLVILGCTALFLLIQILYYLIVYGKIAFKKHFTVELKENDELPPISVIIAVKNDVLSFIEVKTRQSKTYGLPCEAVILSKQKKIHRCAEFYMQSKGIILTMPVLSFDVIEIIKEGTAVKEFHHFPHCF